MSLVDKIRYKLLADPADSQYMFLIDSGLCFPDAVDAYVDAMLRSTEVSIGDTAGTLSFAINK